MADKNLKFTLDFIAKTAGLKDSAQLAEKLGAKLDDSSDSADALAKVMAATADKLEAEMKETAQIAELLGNALGPEMAAKIGQSKIDTIAGEFRAAGLDAKGAEEKIDQLADGVRRLDQVADAAGTLDTKIKDVGKSTDQSRSVMANFTGNAMQELPGMTGMFGPLNMAIGQFGEYAAEGNIQMKNLAATAGPMLGVAVAMELVSRYMKDVAKVKAFNKAEVKAFSDSLREGANVAGEFRDRLEETGKVEFHLNRLFGGDALDSMARAGVTMDQFSAAVFGGKEGIQRLVDAMKAAGVGGGDLADIMLAAQSAQDNYNASVTLATELNKVFGDTDDDVAKVGASWWEVVAGSDGAAAATDRARLASERLALLLGQLDDDEALLNLQQQFDDLKTEAEADYAAVAAGSMTAEQAARNHELKMIDLKRSVSDYATEVLGLPVEQVTDIVANLTEANVAAVESRLNFLARNRNVNITVDGQIADSSLRNLVEGRGRAAGGPVSANTPYIVGEVGPELFVPGGSGNIVPAGKTAAMMSGGAGANVTYNVTINGSNMSADETVRALKEWERRNGTGWRS